MDEQRWHTINKILDTALSLREETRSDYVRETCGEDAILADEILALLETLPKSDAFWKSKKGLNETLLHNYNQTLSDQFTPFRIGKYQVSEVIGQGGMGMVYKAHRADGEFERSVAIKVVSEYFTSEGMLNRFRQERQILAKLNHPNIAVLFDGGVSEAGRPYLVMELISGKPITEYCEDKNSGLSERIELIKKLCSTVQYAHQNLVVHQDIKPSNVLVDERGELKVLDFGIARLLEDYNATDSTAQLMSLQYASPEQVRNDVISTTSDVYNIGLIAYELIAGKKPFDLSGLNRSEVKEKILNEHPAPLPATISRDLESIILKALQKDPKKRYATTNELFEDLLNFQQHYPVKAAYNGISYRITKFLKRNQRIAAIVGFVILAATSFLFYHLRTISSERDKALEEAEKARITSAFMSGVFENADYTRDNETAITSNQFLDDGVEYIHRDLGDYPDVQANLLETVARIHHNLGNLDKAEALYLEVASIREELPSDHPEKHLLASCYHNLGDFYRDRGNYSKSEGYFIQALEQKQNSPDIEFASLGNTMEALGWTWFIQGKTSKADSILSIAQSGYESAQMTETILYSNVLQNLAWIHFSNNDAQKSDSLFRAALSLREELHESNAPNASRKVIAQTLHSLGWVTFVQGNLDEAASFTERAVEIRDQTLGRNHFETAWSLNNLGLIERARNNRDRAGKLLQEAYEIRKEILGESHPHTIQSLNNLTLFEQDLK
ncbi:serine/threonine-protein kinase [Gracilimonas sp.]|uniref:serine/threonine-protein kinase n=1 Tax=Gracilimonas sp. TaxID=1974203 RepID=UPI0032EBC550